MRRLAFTVVELLVVLAIIGVLMALILPAVQYAREAARKTTCQAQLKQIVTAAIAHNTAFEYFPNAGAVDGMARSANSSGIPHGALQQNWGVFYQVLPYIEQKNVWEQTNDADVAAAKIKIYFCPTRRPPTAVPGGTGNGLPRTAMRGGVDYAGNGGAGGQNPTTGAPVVYTNTNPSASMSYQTGVIIPRPGSTLSTEKITNTSVRDGMSNVLMFGERNYHRKPPADVQLDEDNGYINGWSWDTIRWSFRDAPKPDRVALRGSADPMPQSFYNGDSIFGGPHSGVLMLAYCDGSVRPFRYGALDANLFKQLTHRADGKSPQVE